PFLPCLCCSLSVSFVNVPATSELYTLSLHDALPICPGRRLRRRRRRAPPARDRAGGGCGPDRLAADRGEAHAPVLRALRALAEARPQGDGGERPVLGGGHVPRPQGAAPALRRQVPPLRHGAVPEAPRVPRVRAPGRARGGEGRAGRE